MDDLISRQAAIDALYGITTYKNTIPLFSAVFNIEKLPSIDAVKVVRCAGCYHYDEEHSRCLLNGSDFKPTDYCSYGSK